MTRHAEGKQLERATFRTSRLLDFCSRKELIAAKLAHRLGVEPREIGEHTVEVCTGFDFNQRFQDRTRAKPVQMLSSTLSAEIGRDLADGAKRAAARRVFRAPRHDRPTHRHTRRCPKCNGATMTERSGSERCASETKMVFMVYLTFACEK